MALQLRDRVLETASAPGTGTVTLLGASLGYQSFNTALTSGSTTYYTIADLGGANWEVGIGTFTSPNQLARNTILESSGGGTIVNFSSGTQNVFITYPAERSVNYDESNNLSVTDSTFFIQDEADATKKAQFQLSGRTTGTTCVYTLPGTTATTSVLVDQATTQTINGVKTFSNATQNLGSSTATSTANLAYGATVNGSTKTVNIGTGGVAGSTTNITIGSVNGTTTTIYGTSFNDDAYFLSFMMG